MRKILAATALGGALLSGALLSTGTASAFTNGESPTAVFLGHVHALGFQGGANGDRDLVSVGHATCHAVETGSSVASVQHLAEITLTPKGFSVSDADAFVTYSIADLCPHAG